MRSNTMFLSALLAFAVLAAWAAGIGAFPSASLNGVKLLKGYEFLFVLVLVPVVYSLAVLAGAWRLRLPFRWWIGPVFVLLSWLCFAAGFATASLVAMLSESLPDVLLIPLALSAAYVVSLFLFQLLFVKTFRLTLEPKQLLRFALWFALLNAVVLAMGSVLFRDIGSKLLNAIGLLYLFGGWQIAAGWQLNRLVKGVCGAPAAPESTGPVWVRSE